VLGPHPQRRPAGRQNLHRRATVEEVGDPRRRRQHLLAVVEDDEALAGAEERGQGVVQESVAALADAQGLGDRRQHEVGVADPGEVDEDHPVGEAVGHGVGDRQGQAGLAHPAGADQRQEGDRLVQQPSAGGRRFPLATDQRGARRR
jgi:hypothetical protein